MFSLTRLAEFSRAFHASDMTWQSNDAAASLQFSEGLLFSILLVTPFWIGVAMAVHHLIG